ncbi:MAG: cellulase, partial [Cyanobacteria bacterium P01_C01_bin.72]
MATNNIFQTQNQITEDWHGGYKLELELTAESDAINWQVDFELPYSIKEVYGVDLVDNGDGSYTITGQNDQVSLTSGQSIKPIFIIEDGGQEAREFNIIDSSAMTEPTPTVEPEVMTLEMMSADTGSFESMAEETITPEPIEDVVTPEPISEPIGAPVSNPVNIPNSNGQSVGQQGQFAYGEALQKNFLFLEANRSGPLPA